MQLLRKLSLMAAIALFAITLGCSSEVGTDEWCVEMQQKPSGGWTANDIANYGKHCVFN